MSQGATPNLVVLRAALPVRPRQPPLPAPDANGRIAYVGGVPSGGMLPGAYEVRLILAQGAEKASTSTRFELVP